MFVITHTNFITIFQYFPGTQIHNDHLHNLNLDKLQIVDEWFNQVKMIH